ncbi:hypothetical protein Sros01_36220 [Streptomyces roseochromogenus]|nr:hypothetical protein Sros01_36220 [Streptomyces roseochromogenus]
MEAPRSVGSPKVDLSGRETVLNWTVGGAEVERGTRKRVAAAARAAMGACAATVLAGCFAGEQGPGGSAPGPAGVSVTVVRGDRTYPLTATITQWEVRPHPQVPERGNAVHYTYRLAMTDTLPETRVQLAACAVDSTDVVLLCDTINVHQSPSPLAEVRDAWIGPSPDPDLSRTARVVLLPDQLLDDGRAHDPKDHDGYAPPGLPLPGDHLRTS